MWIRRTSWIVSVTFSLTQLAPAASAAQTLRQLSTFESGLARQLTQDVASQTLTPEWGAALHQAYEEYAAEPALPTTPAELGAAHPERGPEEQQALAHLEAAAGALAGLSPPDGTPSASPLITPATRASLGALWAGVTDVMVLLRQSQRPVSFSAIWNTGFASLVTQTGLTLDELALELEHASRQQGFHDQWQEIVEHLRAAQTLLLRVEAGIVSGRTVVRGSGFAVQVRLLRNDQHVSAIHLEGLQLPVTRVPLSKHWEFDRSHTIHMATLYADGMVVVVRANARGRPVGRDTWKGQEAQTALRQITDQFPGLRRRLVEFLNSPGSDATPEEVTAFARLLGEEGAVRPNEVASLTQLRGRLRGKVVFLRGDFNILDETIPDDSPGRIKGDRIDPISGAITFKHHSLRLRRVLPTIRLALEEGARLILVTHVGRPRGKVVEKLRTAPIAERLSEMLGGVPVKTVQAVSGPEVAQAVAALQPGEILMIENPRFDPREESLEPAMQAALAAEWAQLADVSLFDAFGAGHRAGNASLGALADAMRRQGKPAVVGVLMREEEAGLELVLNPQRQPLVAIFGGGKGEKIEMLQVMVPHLQQDNAILVGGLLGNWLNGGNDDEATRTKAALERDAAQRSLELISPGDPTAHDGRDLDEPTLTRFLSVIDRAGTVVWNGPLGVYEDPRYRAATEAVARRIAERTQRGELDSVLLGDDTATAVQELGIPETAFSFISTGGGAGLEYLRYRGTLPIYNHLSPIAEVGATHRISDASPSRTAPLPAAATSPRNASETGITQEEKRVERLGRPDGQPIASAGAGIVTGEAGTTMDPEQEFCVTGDTLLAIAECGLQNAECEARDVAIKDVKAGMLVYSLNEATGKIEPHRINALLDMGVKPVYRLTTASGRSIRTTGEHPYLTRSGWQNVRELEVGEEIAVATPLEQGGKVSEISVTKLGLERGQPFVDVNGHGQFPLEGVHPSRELTAQRINTFIQPVNPLIQPVNLFVQPLISRLNLLIHAPDLHPDSRELRFEIAQLWHDQFLDDPLHVHRHGNLLAAQGYHVARAVSRRWRSRVHPSFVG